MRDNTTQFYLPDQKRVAVVRTDEARGISIRQILATPVRNWRTIFRDFMLISDNAKLKSGEVTFHLKVMPIMEARFKSSELWVDSSGFIRQFRFNYANGDFASFYLYDLKENQKLGGTPFNIEVPPDVVRPKS